MGTINNTIPRYDVCIYLNTLSNELFGTDLKKTYFCNNNPHIFNNIF